MQRLDSPGPRPFEIGRDAARIVGDETARSGKEGERLGSRCVRADVASRFFFRTERSTLVFPAGTEIVR